MTARRALAALLAVVAAAAAVLSFDALRGLAERCGFSPWMALLLPVVVDAGAAAGSLVWLGGRPGDPARRFARRLALTLLGGSVVANSVDHLLTVYTHGVPPWWVVAVASGVAPAVLAAMVHLAVSVRRDELPAELPASPIEEDAPPPADTSDASPAVGLHSVPSPTHPGDAGDDPGDRVAELVAAGAGWRKVQEATGLSEHHAKKAVREHREASG